MNIRVICNRLQEIKKIDIQAHKKKEQKQNKIPDQLYKIKETINKIFKVILTKRSEICLSLIIFLYFMLPYRCFWIHLLLPQQK